VTGQEAMGTFLKGKFCLAIGIKFFPVRRIKHWRSLSRQVVGSAVLEMFRTGLDGALDNLV